jgi:hypothetical protein
MTIDLRTCQPGQKLRSKHGLILTYVKQTDDEFHPHDVEYPNGSWGSRTNEGFTFSNPACRVPEDHDIVEILPMETKEVDCGAFIAKHMPKG